MHDSSKGFGIFQKLVMILWIGLSAYGWSIMQGQVTGYDGIIIVHAGAALLVLFAKPGSTSVNSDSKSATNLSEL